MSGLVTRLVASPDRVRAELLDYLPTAPPDDVVATRHGFIDIDGYVKRYNRPALAEARRCARLCEWEMARRWPAKDSTGRRGDDRPLVDAHAIANKEAWQRIYAVGRADRDWLLSEQDPNQLTQAKVIRSTTPEPQPFTGILQGDARQVLADVEDESVDLILTDPPYGDQARDLYTWLGEFAARTLMPGGSLAVMTGQSRLPDDLDRLAHPQLRYWWTFAFMHGTSQRLPGVFVMAGWKPVLWFVKGHRSGRTMIGDVLRGRAYDKDEHAWAQGDGISPIITELCPEGGLIVDPFAGTGHWGELATSLGRRWTGADVGGAVIVA